MSWRTYITQLCIAHVAYWLIRQEASTPPYIYSRLCFEPAIFILLIASTRLSIPSPIAAETPSKAGPLCNCLEELDAAAMNFINIAGKKIWELTATPIVLSQRPSRPRWLVQKISWSPGE